MIYSRVLVPLDGSELAEQALPYARLLGHSLKCNVELLHISGSPISLAEPLTGHPHLEELKERRGGRIGSYLERMAHQLQQEGLAASFSVRHGSPAVEIVLEAEREPATLLTMATHGYSGITRWMLGSVTDKVLHASTVPLFLVRPRAAGKAPAEPRPKNIIVPLDGSPLAEQVLPHATALAKAMSIDLNLVRVTPSAGEYHRYMEYHLDVGPGAPMARVYEGPYKEFSKKADLQVMEYLHRLGDKVRRQGALWVEEKLLHGHPAQAIVELARKGRGSLVVMSTHGRSGVGRWLLGSVTDRVVRYGAGPVLVVRAKERS